MSAEQLAYYRARAAEYDHDAYESKSDDWKEEMARLVARLEGSPLRGEVVELAAGTGYWTARLLARGCAVTALDGAPEMLAINRARSGCRSVVAVDLLTWTPRRTWDGLVACFWLSHVPDERLDHVLSSMVAAVRPGGALFVADKVEGRGNTARTLRDGRTFEVVDRTRSAAELRDAFGRAGIDVAVDAVGHRFVAITGVRG